MINDNDLLLMLSSSLQNNETYKVYIDSSGKKTLTPQTHNWEADDPSLRISCHSESVTVYGLLAGKNPKKVIFPNCSRAAGYKTSGAFYMAFENCTSLTSVSFPALTTATGNNNYGAFGGAFQNCTSLTSISFPSLTTVGTETKADVTFRSAFSNCSPSLKVHFKKSMKGKPGLDYKTMGLTSADQVVFDLP